MAHDHYILIATVTLVALAGLLLLNNQGTIVGQQTYEEPTPTTTGAPGGPDDCDCGCAAEKTLKNCLDYADKTHQDCLNPQVSGFGYKPYVSREQCDRDLKNQQCVCQHDYNKNIEECGGGIPASEVPSLADAYKSCMDDCANDFDECSKNADNSKVLCLEDFNPSFCDNKYNEDMIDCNQKRINCELSCKDDPLDC